MSFDLGELERKATSVVHDTQQLGEAFVENTMDDIQAILGNVAECARQIDAIRVRVTNRAVEYQTGVFRVLVDAAVLPVTLIEEVWRIVAPDLIVAPNPRLFKLTNPRQAVWDGASPSFVEIPPSFDFPDRRFAFFIVHGKDYSGSEGEAFQSMYKPFERSARMFNSSYTYWAEYSDIYLVTYDSRLTDEAQTLIRRGFESVLGTPVVGAAPMLTAAVFWRELERRAELTGEYLARYLPNVYEEYGGRWGHVVSHSLGCFAAATALKAYALRVGDASPLTQWLCMAAALPANAFTNSGVFRESLDAVKRFENESYGTFVIFSYLDSVLGTAYSFANSTLAMGQTGALIPVKRVANTDATSLVGETHTISGGYLDMLGPILRAIYSTDLRVQIEARASAYLNANTIAGVISRGPSQLGCVDLP